MDEIAGPGGENKFITNKKESKTMMDMEYAAYLAVKHQCRCIGPQMDGKGEIACFLFNDASGAFKTTFGAKTESEFINRLASLRRVAA